jgi:N-terminal half of MaoC dehydratase
LSADVTYELPIERGAIRHFARATMSSDPAYEGPAAIVPPTFLTTARLRWEPAGANPLDTLGFDRKRLLHAQEEYRFHGPLPVAGEMLTATARLVDQYERTGKRGGALRFAVVLTEYRDSEGVLRAEQRTTAVETSRPPTASRT